MLLEAAIRHDFWRHSETLILTSVVIYVLKINHSEQICLETL